MNDLSPTILLVDDNEDDLYALKRSLKKAGVTNPLQIATDGQQVIDYLAGEKDFAERARFPLPFLIFLDLKLPYRDGFDVLAWIRQQPALQSIVVVVLTGSDETKDHQRAHELGARSYMVKPPSPADISQLADAMPNHWSRPAVASLS